MDLNSINNVPEAVESDEYYVKVHQITGSGRSLSRSLAINCRAKAIPVTSVQGRGILNFQKGILQLEFNNQRIGAYHYKNELSNKIYHLSGWYYGESGCSSHNNLITLQICLV